MKLRMAVLVLLVAASGAFSSCSQSKSTKQPKSNNTIIDRNAPRVQQGPGDTPATNSGSGGGNGSGGY